MTLTCDNKNGDDPIPRKRKHVVSKKQQSKAKKTRQSLNNNTTQIESEFKVLQSLIPPIANRQQLTELEIIDACLSYIESLQSQLMVNPEDTESFCGGLNYPKLPAIVSTNCNGNLGEESE